MPRHSAEDLGLVLGLASSSSTSSSRPFSLLSLFPPSFSAVVHGTFVVGGGGVQVTFKGPCTTTTTKNAAQVTGVFCSSAIESASEAPPGISFILSFSV